MKLPEVIVTQIFSTQSNVKLLSLLFRNRQKTPSEISEEISNTVIDYKNDILSVSRGGKLHDLGPMINHYGIPKGFAVADFGGTDTKFLGPDGKEVKLKHNPKLLDEEGFKTLIEYLQEFSKHWPEGYTYVIRAGSIIKSDKTGQVQEKLERMIATFNKCGRPQIHPEVLIENSSYDLMGRLLGSTFHLQDKTPFTGFLTGKLLLIGGPLTYGVPIVSLTHDEMVYTSKDRKTGQISEIKAEPSSKMGYKLYYYWIAFIFLIENDFIDLSKHIVLIGPTGSNPTISTVNPSRGKICVYEFETRNFKSGEPWLPIVGMMIKVIDIPEELKDTLC